MTKEELQALANEYADEYYDKDSDRNSVMPESILHSNRTTNFIAGYAARDKQADEETTEFIEWITENGYSVFKGEYYDGNGEPSGTISELLKLFRESKEREK